MHSSYSIIKVIKGVSTILGDTQHARQTKKRPEIPDLSDSLLLYRAGGQVVTFVWDDIVRFPLPGPAYGQYASANVTGIQSIRSNQS